MEDDEEYFYVFVSYAAVQRNWKFENEPAE